MALKICDKGHLTGTRECGRCGGKTTTVKGPAGRRGLDKLTKRLITKGLRAIGYPAAADL
jgi:hypothetical protein